MGAVCVAVPCSGPGEVDSVTGEGVGAACSPGGMMRLPSGARSKVVAPVGFAGGGSTGIRHGGEFGLNTAAGSHSLASGRLLNGLSCALTGPKARSITASVSEIH